MSLSEHRSALAELLHTEEFSRIDNNDKVPVIVDLGTCPETGARLYDLHPRRELFYDNNEILDELTGRNRFDETKPNEPHPTWKEIVRATTTESRKNGIKGSTKLIQQCKCPCMKKMKASFFSCEICEEMKEAITRFEKLRGGWRQQANLKRKQVLTYDGKKEGKIVRTRDHTIYRR